MNWQSQASEYLVQGDYNQLVGLYEQAIEVEPDVASHYWHLGLAYLLQGQEEMAQVTWLAAISSQGNGQDTETWTAELVQILETEAQRQKSIARSQPSWLIRQHIREIDPGNINNLLHLILLSIETLKLTLNDISEWGINQIIKESSRESVDLQLLFQVIPEILYYFGTEPQVLEFTETCWFYVSQPHQFREILTSAVFGKKRVDRTQNEGKYFDNSWFWPFLDEYRDPEGRTLEEVEFSQVPMKFESELERENAIKVRRWAWSPKSEKEVNQLLNLLEGFFHLDEQFTYLEFGACFGTTFCSVLARFPNAKGIGLEVDQYRFDVTKWLIERLDKQFSLVNRVKLYNQSVLDAPLEQNSIDVVLMDTNHKYPDDFDYVMHLINSGVLRKNFLFIGDDPLHTGTDIARKRFIEEHSHSHKIITRKDKNLWWFFEK